MAFFFFFFTCRQRWTLSLNYSSLQSLLSRVFFFRHFAFFFFRESYLHARYRFWYVGKTSSFRILDNFRPSITIFHFPRVLLALFFPTSQPLSTALDLLPRERAILPSRIASCVRYRVSSSPLFHKRTRGKNLAEIFAEFWKKTRNLTTFVHDKLDDKTRLLSFLFFSFFSSPRAFYTNTLTYSRWHLRTIFNGGREQHVKSRDSSNARSYHSYGRQLLYSLLPVSSTRVLSIRVPGCLYVHIDDAQQTTIVACSSSES